MSEDKKSHPADIYAGYMVKKIRFLKNVSQEVLAKQLNVTYQQLQKYERGINRISVGRLADISKALGVPPAIFFKL